MILYLLVPVLVPGVVESQTVNITNTLGTGEIDRNQTFNVFTLDNSTTKPNNVKSGFFKDEERKIEDELKKNLTSFISEDSALQNTSFPHQQCPQQDLMKYGEIYCVEPFRSKMREISTEDWCVMESIIRPYNEMTLCIEDMSRIFGCFYPNQAVHSLFLRVHSSYFQNCTKEELLFEDAPPWLGITLTLIPVSLIPVLTYVVVWKSKVQK